MKENRVQLVVTKFLIYFSYTFWEKAIRYNDTSY